MAKRLNKSCKFYPCHEQLQDCTFCYCPFYPCLNEDLGRYVYSPKCKENVWSCLGCDWIHKRGIVDDIFSSIRRNSRRPKTSGQKPKGQKTGIIILGHGSKRRQANKIILDIVRAIRRQGWDIAEPAYLQFHQPHLATSIRNVVERGSKRVIVVPFFLFMGNHVTRDIPRAIKKEAAKYPGVNFVYAKNLGEDSRIDEIVLDRIREAIAKCP